MSRSARLIDISDAEARRLSRFLSAAIFAVIALVGFGRYGLMDEDSGAPHVIGLIIALVVCGIYVLIVVWTRGAAEALIRGRRSGGMDPGAVRAAVAQAWLTIGIVLIAGLLFVFFVAGLSLGLLSYYHAVVSTLGILLIVLVLERLTERVWHIARVPASGRSLAFAELRARTLHHIVLVIGLAAAAWLLAWIWADADRDVPGGGGHGDALGDGRDRHAVHRLHRLGIGAAGDRPASAGDEQRAEPAGRRRRRRGGARHRGCKRSCRCCAPRSPWRSRSWRC